jgi:hypothetical protein
LISAFLGVEHIRTLFLVVSVLDMAKRLGVGKLGVGVTPDEK